MKKVIALSTVLVFGALGMACDGGAPNANTNTNAKPAATVAPPATLAPVTNANTNSNSTAKPTDTAKPADANANKMDPKKP